MADSQPQNQQNNAQTPKDGPPVIDLRMLDEPTASSQTPAGGSPGNPAPVSQTQASQTQTALASGEDESEFVMMGSQRYTIPELVRTKFPDLKKLILETESMNDEEREYWFQILPIMTEEQIKKFRDILINEKDQLARLDREYEGELKKLNDKHLVELKAFESKEKRKALAEAEAKSDQSEEEAEKELLKRLSQV